MCSEEEYDKWEKGELLFNDGSFVTKEEAIEELKKNKWFVKNNPDFDFTDEEAVNEALSDNEYKTSNQYWDNCYYETFEDTYTTKNGEKIIAFGYYGYDS
jgi:hypothetical protein